MATTRDDGLSRGDSRAMRDMGRQAMSQVVGVALRQAVSHDLLRTFAVVSKVNGDGTVDLECGSDETPMPLNGVRITLGCSTVSVGDTVVVDTYDHSPLVVAVLYSNASSGHTVASKPEVDKANESAASAKRAADSATESAASAKSKAEEAASDAASAATTANAAKSAASAAQGTANGAKSTADSLATLIRADSTGITVGKSADGQTYSTGRTRMTDSAFQVLDKAGKVITQLAADGASFLSGLVRIVAGKATLPGNKTVNSIVIDAGDGMAALHGIISRLDATINGIKSSVSAGWEQDFGSGVVLVSRNTSTNEASAFAVYPYGVRVDGLTVSQAACKSDGTSDLNYVDYGVCVFTPSTGNNPTGDGYGYCITVSNGNDGTYGYWRQQVALVNTNGIYTRECINPTSGSSWTSWRRMTHYSKPLITIYRLYNQYSGAHHWVDTYSEYNNLVQAGWTGEGVAYYAYQK